MSNEAWVAVVLVTAILVLVMALAACQVPLR
jgi:hypothetical protein